MSARNAYLTSINTPTMANVHFGTQFDIATCTPHTIGRSVTSHTVTLTDGRTYIVRVGETLPTSAV